MVKLNDLVFNFYKKKFSGTPEITSREGHVFVFESIINSLQTRTKIEPAVRILIEDWKYRKPPEKKTNKCGSETKL